MIACPVGISLLFAPVMEAPSEENSDNVRSAPLSAGISVSPGTLGGAAGAGEAAGARIPSNRVGFVP